MLAKINKVVQRTWANISYRKRVDLRLKAPVISFTFDDAPASAFVTGGGLLHEFGYRGTFYVALSFLQKNSEQIHFDTQHLHIARQQGHELACHTHDHLDVSQVNMSVLKKDITANQQEIDQVIPGYAFRNFAFPFGAQTRSSKQWLASQYRSARGNRHGINRGQVDLMNLKGIRLYEQKFRILDLIFPISTSNIETLVYSGVNAARVVHI